MSFWRLWRTCCRRTGSGLSFVMHKEMILTPGSCRTSGATFATGRGFTPPNRQTAALAAAKCRGVSRCIYPYTLHWMRHTFATICYDAGVDVKSAASMLGHANEQTTMEIYTHLTKSWEQASVEKLDAYLSQQKERAAG